MICAEDKENNDINCDGHLQRSFICAKTTGFILNQTIRDFELIICDDYSTDNTWDVLQENANRDHRIHCYRNESNLGFKILKKQCVYVLGNLLH